MDNGGGLGGGDLGLGGNGLGASAVERLRVLWKGLPGELTGIGGGLTGVDEDVVNEDWNGPNSVLGDLGG